MVFHGTKKDFSRGYTGRALYDSVRKRFGKIHQTESGTKWFRSEHFVRNLNGQKTLTL